MASKIKFLLVLSIVAFLFACNGKDNTSNVCPEQTCQNSGVWVSDVCECRCPTGFIGTNCDTYQNPSAMYIDTIWISAFTMKTDGGNNWDLGVGLDTNPDIYPTILDNNQSTVFKYSGSITNADGTKSYWFKPESSLKITVPSNRVFTLELWDKDLGTAIDPDDLMASFTTVLRGNNVPFYKVLTFATTKCKYQFSVRYEF